MALVLPVPERPSVKARVLALAPYITRAVSQVQDLIFRVPMIERYRVLAAMLALEEFTHQRLAEFSGVKLATVRTVLNRERSWWVEIGQEEVRRRGGRSKILRITPEGSAAIGKELTKIHAAVDPVAVKETPGFAWTEGEDPLLPLLHAEAVLREHFVAAKTPAEREEVLATVTMGLRNAERVLDRLPVAGRRKTDREYRERLRFLWDVTARISAGELAAEQVQDELGTPFEIPEEVTYPGQGGVYVISPRSDTQAIISRARQIEEKIREAASEAGVVVLERSGEITSPLGGTAVFFVHSSKTHKTDHVLRQILATVRERMVVLDLDADESLRNMVLANQGWYLSDAVTLDINALVGTLARFRGASVRFEHGPERFSAAGAVATNYEKHPVAIAEPV